MKNGLESELRPGTMPGWPASVVPARVKWEISAGAVKSFVSAPG